MKCSKHIDGIELKCDEVLDTFLQGKIRLIQHKSGYRFSIDAILLADFVSVKKDDVIVELGTGCGVVLVMVLMKYGDIKKAVGIEIQEELASQALRNAKLNKVEDKMDVIVADLRACPIGESCVDLVVCNPPYRKVRTGRINPEMQKAIARHEILSSLEDVLRTTRFVLRPKGRLALIYPAERLAHVISKLRKFQLEPKRICIQYPSMTARAKLVIVEAIKGARPGLHIEPPVVGQGKYSIL